jgi:methylthioribose-1-phosphate isomerase
VGAGDLTPETVAPPIPRPVAWGGGFVRILDQTELPHDEVVLECRTVGEVADAIRGLAVRGAPMLGIAAAYAIALAAHRGESLRDAGDLLIATRPTAVNIRWAVRRVLDAPDALEEAKAIEREDEAACFAIGEHGAALVPDAARILTHCNTGMLCTAGIGTAQGVIWTAHRQGKGVHVWVDETRPLLQGARLTAWELTRLGVPFELVTDNAAASLMRGGLVDVVIVGADRIAANGDVANKIGTYGLAVLASHHGIPFFVAAPTSTIDIATPSGAAIPIEQRGPEEVTAPLGIAVAARGTPARNPAFDVTPAELVTAIVTERGVLRPPFPESLTEVVGGARA